MISYILCSRVKNNIDSAIELWLDSLVACGGNAENSEVIVKYDSDDDHAPPQEFFNKYPFEVKKFVWSQGEGRHAFHLDHPYLFAQHNPRATHILIAADDFTYTRPGFMNDILAIKDQYCIIGVNRPRMEFYSGKWTLKPYMDIWKHNEGICAAIFPVKTVEVLQNFGWQCNVDNWVTLLCILMYEKYGLDIWKGVAPFFQRNPQEGTSGFTPTYNNMEMDGIRNPENRYYFNLVEQQVKNLYLNIKYGEKHA
jgi:hypothetical protein